MAYWIRRQDRIVGLNLPDCYGRDRVVGIADLLGRFTPDQLKDLRDRLPVRESN